MKRLFLLALFVCFSCFGQNSSEKFESFFSDISMLEIPKGSRFILKDGFHSFSYSEYHKKGNGKKLKSSDYLNEILIFESYEEKKGNIFFVFSTSKGAIEYNTNKSLNELKSKSCLNIPYLFYYEDILIAEKILIGKRIVQKKKQSDYELLRYPLSIFIVDSIKYSDLYNSIKIFAHNEINQSLFDFNASFSATNKSSCKKTMLFEYFFDKYQLAEDYEYVINIAKKEKANEQKNRDAQLAYVMDVDSRRKDAVLEVKDDCHYIQNRKDPFKKTDEIITEAYSLYSGSFIIGRFNISIIKYGSQKYLRIYSTDEVGCTSPYESNRSKVFFKLKNGNILNFYHSGDLDCGTFNLLGKLSKNEVSQLKESPIDIVRIEGTKYYSDIDNLYWKTFFQDKLECLEN